MVRPHRYKLTLLVGVALTFFGVNAWRSARRTSALDTHPPARHPRADDWARLYWIVDEVRTDYYEAVEEEEPEAIVEQLELLDEGVALAKSLGVAPKLLERLEEIRAGVRANADPVRTAKRCAAALDDIIRTRSVSRAPTAAPDLRHGHELFTVSCEPCHGAPGNEDPPPRMLQDPKPPKLHASEQRERLTPFRVFNTLRFGGLGMSMPSFPGWTEKDRWDVAFYTAAIRYERCEKEAPKQTLETLATTVDDVLGLRLGEEHLACLRLHPAGH